ncbi:hypothetical protein HWV62_13409 [Athelia sp. TMB]|nr:hypothetical protein HWV62_13409 [Athelia sp. TMB]
MAGPAQIGNGFPKRMDIRLATLERPHAYVWYYIISESGRAVELEAADIKNSPVCLRSPPNRRPTYTCTWASRARKCQRSSSGGCPKDFPAALTPWSLGEESITHIKAAYDADINTFDTANAHWNGLSEPQRSYQARRLSSPEIVVMTKVFFTVGHTPEAKDTLESGGYVNQRGLSRKHIFESVAHSLRRLQLDYDDVLQCHWFDDNTPIEETMRALHDVVQVGHARYLGMSSCYAWQFHMMQNYAITNGLTPFISMQNHYCTLYREEESPLARGILTRPLAQASTSKRQDTDPILGMYLKNPKRQKDRRPAGGGGGAHRREHGTDRARVADGQGRGDGADCGDDVAGEPAEPAWCVL